MDDSSGPASRQETSPAAAGLSLIVKLKLNLCAKCTDALQRWFEPVRPYDYDAGWMDVYDTNRSYPVSPEESFLRRSKEGKTAEWLWSISDLRSNASQCSCCTFILRALDICPWMAYGDEDFVLLKSQLVGSKHSEKLDTPRERDDYDSQFNFGNRPRIPYSKYDRYHRPVLKLYRKRQETYDQPGSHAAAGFMFILPVARLNLSLSDLQMNSQTFHGRMVASTVDLSLIRQWFEACKAQHTRLDKTLASPIWKEQPVEECKPKPRQLIPHFRLIDVSQRCVVLAHEQDTYAALSYVWGCAKRLLLTVENLGHLSTPGVLSSNNEEVPQTFTDALFIAEQLGIEFIWIDALCVVQNKESELVEHMNLMDQIYSSAVLTIVSDADNANSGIPGVSTPRKLTQVTFNHGSKTYINAKRTFGQALSDSHWERRAWCLQEKVFSKRLLIFTESQCFYHCNSTTWFEDTIMEPKEHVYDSINIAERASPSSKSMPMPGHTAYEAHRLLFQRNFWSLIEIYSQRQLSFESDAIHAFNGILKSIEAEFGPAHWGVPEYLFARGITWTHPKLELRHRNPQFPSWSWASWRGDSQYKIHFGNVQTEAADIWNIDFHFHKVNVRTGSYELTPAKRSYTQHWSTNKPILRRPIHKMMPEIDSKPISPQIAQPGKLFAWPEATKMAATSQRYQYSQHRNRREMGNVWGISGHPGEEDYNDPELPLYKYNPMSMPPLSHIVRFFTSCAQLFVDAEPDPEYQRCFHARDKHTSSDHYSLRVASDRSVVLDHIQLDSDWGGKGKEHEFIFVSPGFWPPSDRYEEPSTIIWIMLVEDFEAAPEVKRRVRQFGPMDISTWRRAKPVWKCINLA